MKVFQNLVFIFSTIATKFSLACPICLTETGQQVRDGIFNSNFVLYLFYSLLPFICFFLIIYAAYHGKISFIRD
ncbi:Uncharacterised protein [Legionella busanensis]|uniref:Uncharacterized protein n=1 Tax=Legionella busanensis TaxID=190655 RepID=A0A378JN12_9GAMM|nr:Uncharacterised protein [Legionella busanensis]